MPKNKKKFIAKENAIVFQLVHRSQQDPLVADDKAPQHVLKEFTKKNREEEHKYGIFFDDEYDYLQHLKTVTEPLTSLEEIKYKPNEKRRQKKFPEMKILLPSSVFQSDFEVPVGLLNKAAPVYGPRPELDPDIVAAMDDDFDYDNPENILEENFMELANQSGSEEYNNEVESHEDLQSELSLIESKSRFTEYSMTSSVIRRNEKLVLLDDHFEKVFKKYDENEIGCLPHEDIDGILPTQNPFDSEKLLKLTTELQNTEEEHDLDLKKKTILAAAKQHSCEEETNLVIVEKEAEKWDCDSVLSTYSNCYNHPAKICETKQPHKIKINKKTGIAEGELNGSKLTAEVLSMLHGPLDAETKPKSIVSYISELSIRPKNESSEERRLRKQNIREFRRDRRMEKKANTLAFKNEKCRQEKIFFNLKNSQQGISLY
ncbi:hypothetical protein RUM43_008430 [Polyplax serrata]|uniref:Protein LTV1 homolog n=1 Tax=Polyplax serrata TaxID=468196 RepID=A0AAN8P9C5_POLSC